ncbi:hypothetical protein Plhal304r1_c031g0100921 [Plasmopara halstedii]
MLLHVPKFVTFKSFAQETTEIFVHTVVRFTVSTTLTTRCSPSTRTVISFEPLALVR